MADTLTDFDLGFEVANNNLFENFHKAQDVPGEVKPIMIGPDKTNDGAAKKDEGAADKTPPGEVKLDLNSVQELLKKSQGGTVEPNEPVDDKDTPPDGKPAAVKPAATAAAEPVGDAQFTVLHDHLVDTLGFEPLTQEELAAGGVTEENFLEFHQRNINTKATGIAEDMIADAFENNPNAEVASDLLRFLANKGDISDFVATRKDDVFTADYLNVTDDDDKEARAERLMRSYQTATGMEPAAVEKLVGTLKTSGSLVAVAETTLPQFIRLKDQRKAIADQNLEATRRNNESAVKEYNTNLFKILDGAKEIGPYKLTPVLKTKLKEFMYAPSVEVNGRKVPAYLAKLEEQRKNPQFALMQALSLMEGNDAFKLLKNEGAEEAKKTLKQKMEELAKGKKLDQPGAATADKAPRNTASDQVDFDNIQFA